MWYILLLFVTISGQQLSVPLRFDHALSSLHSRIKYLQQSQLIVDDIQFDNLSLNDDPYFNNTACERDVDVLSRAVLNKETWALKFLDSWGKPAAGLLQGNIFWLGSYEECLSNMYQMNKTYLSQPFQGQYCTILPQSVEDETSFEGFTGLVYGICVPESCNKTEIVVVVKNLIKSKSNITENYLQCSNKNSFYQRSLSTGAIVAIAIISLLAILVLIGTIVDLFLSDKLREFGALTHANGYNYMSDTLADNNSNNLESVSVPRYSRVSLQVLIDTSKTAAFLAEFSALRTLLKIFSLKESAESFTFLNGIRVLSLLWVIFGHTYVFGFFYTDNIAQIFSWTQQFLFQLITNAVFSVDTFFVISGFLTAVL
ncbi:unnamed protein product, partial [Didymodactylos carnosus]